MRVHWTTLVIAALASVNFLRPAPAQVLGPQPPAEKATTPTLPPKAVQPVPGAMTDSDAVPSTISERNASDDKLPTIAFRLRNLTDDQRRAIVGSLAGTPVDSTTASSQAPPQIGTIIRQNDSLRPLPPELGARIPEVKDLQYEIAGQVLVLVDPLQRAVLAVLSR